MKKLILAAIIVMLIGCTDAQRGKLTALGSSASVKCYSGGKLIYEGESTGKVSSEENSDGYYFVDKDTEETLEVSGNCIINYH